MVGTLPALVEIKTWKWIQREQGSVPEGTYAPQQRAVSWSQSQARKESVFYAFRRSATAELRRTVVKGSSCVKVVQNCPCFQLPQGKATERNLRSRNEESKYE